MDSVISKLVFLIVEVPLHCSTGDGDHEIDFSSKLKGSVPRTAPTLYNRLGFVCHSLDGVNKVRRS